MKTAQATSRFSSRPGVRWLAIASACVFGAPLGCHSAFVNATITNHSGHPIRILELDYPSASFGTSDLADGATFKYRFKILGSGPASLQWTDIGEKEHTSPGPELEEGQEGSLAVSIEPETATWSKSLHH